MDITIYGWSTRRLWPWGLADWGGVGRIGSRSSAMAPIHDHDRATTIYRRTTRADDQSLPTMTGGEWPHPTPGGLGIFGDPLDGVAEPRCSRETIKGLCRRRMAVTSRTLASMASVDSAADHRGRDGSSGRAGAEAVVVGAVALKSACARSAAIVSRVQGVGSTIRLELALFDLAVCAEMVLLDLPFEQRVRRIAEYGFQVEIWNWTYHDIDALVQTGAQFSLDGLVTQLESFLTMTVLTPSFGARKSPSLSPSGSTAAVCWCSAPSSAPTACHCARYTRSPVQCGSTPIRRCAGRPSWASTQA